MRAIDRRQELALAGTTVLIVENDPDVREIVGEILGARGVLMMTAANGRDALEQLAVAKVRPDLILLDLTMPVMNGWDFLEAKAADPAIATIPVIVMSAAQDLEPARGRWVDVMRKPVRLETLYATIERHAQLA
jgi:CheY-like chemotaxis protein